MFRKLLNRLRTPVPEALEPARDPAIHIHEDDWGMRNLFPASCLYHVAGDIAEAKAFGDAHFDGGGWTEMRAIQSPPTSFREAGVTIASLVAALEPILPRVRRFNATISSMINSDSRDPYGSYETDAICFGYHRDCFIKIDPADDVLVGAVWYQADRCSHPELDALRRGLLAINAATPVVVADYWLDFSGPLTDPALVERYFAELSQDSEPAGT